MPDYKVVITDHNFKDISVEENVLGDIATIEEFDSDTENLKQHVSDADAVLVRMKELRADVIETMQECEIISRYGIGVDHIDVDAATLNNIWVGNAATYCVDEVAVHAVSLVLNMNRRIKTFDSLMANGGWKTSPPRFDPGGSENTPEKRLPVSELSTETVGIVGYGTIGRRVGEYLSVFSDTVLVYDPQTEPSEIDSETTELVTFDELLNRADYISIHAPLTERTQGMFDERAFEKMKTGAYVVNVARGGIVDERDLIDALDDDQIAGAALDVFEEEPPQADNPLLNHENVITTPHVAYYSQTAEKERRLQAAENVRRVLTGDRPLHPVNTIADN